MSGKYKVSPDSTRTAFGCLAALSFVLGLYFCDLSMTPGSPEWVKDATIWSGILFFFFFLFWGLMRAQDDNI